MILQNIIMPGKLNINPQIYYRTLGEIYEGKCGIVIPKGNTFSTDTYMNAFDVGTWKKYTAISDLVLRVKVCGSGEIRVWKEKLNQIRQVISRQKFDSGGLKVEDEKELVFEIPKDLVEGVVYFEIYAAEDSILSNATFETTDTTEYDIKISLVICTYKRREQLEQLLTELSAQEKKEMRSWLRIKVIDNASELPNQYGEDIQVYHNPNTGGSGGFSRGMDETVNDLKQFPATHVVFMDDDVTIQTESIIRLYALLSFMKKKYESEVVAGRMFRLDKPEVQYTASEIWNTGDIRHIGWNQDMTVYDRLFDMNENAGGEYSGWWFACFPIGFVKENRPLPFFLHCDDVEYGLRHGGEPIILNGIQVWHETYEYRQSLKVLYYDVRNSLIVNTMYEELSQEEFLAKWKIIITEFHIRAEYQKEYIAIKAMKNFLRGQKNFQRNGNKEVNFSVSEKETYFKYSNKLLWRYCQMRLRKKYSLIKEQYREGLKQ